ncbi:hypothetical protein CC80DRAFT_502781 [Byssothecium circinans]|uniref:F-box domain-containing protein n=1 Tax=Byssothecium circinans TaxID=147558 RepID=A0A6A5U4V4_9PLEO|nr:hypothetical protein CC80DRAFT_502781 [Byssothecium circinans]
MSLTALPNELQDYILAFLFGDRQALAAVARTSRRFQGLAEPFLYRSVSFHTGERPRIKQLLHTFLVRPELAERVADFTLAIEPRPQQELSFHEHRRAHGALQPHITAMGDGFSSLWDPRWWEFSNLVLVPQSYDGALALLLRRTTNLETLSLSLSKEQGLKVTLAMLRLEGTRIPKPHDRPIRKFRHFSILSYPTPIRAGNPMLPLQIMAGILSVQYTGCILDRRLSIRTLGCTSTLRNLRLKDLTIASQTLRKAINSPALRSLKIFRGSKSLNSRGSSLEELKIDYEIMYPKNTHDYFRPYSWPRGLKRPELTSCPTRINKDLHNGPENSLSFLIGLAAVAASPGPSSSSSASTDSDNVSNLNLSTPPKSLSSYLVRTIGASDQLRYVFFEYVLEEWVPGDSDLPEDNSGWSGKDFPYYAAVQFRIAADSLAKQGVLLEVYRQEGLFERERRLLVGPNLVARPPHSRMPPTESEWRHTKYFRYNPRSVLLLLALPSLHCRVHVGAPFPPHDGTAPAHVASYGVKHVKRMRKETGLVDDGSNTCNAVSLRTLTALPLELSLGGGMKFSRACRSTQCLFSSTLDLIYSSRKRFRYFSQIHGLAFVD